MSDRARTAGDQGLAELRLEEPTRPERRTRRVRWFFSGYRHDPRPSRLGTLEGPDPDAVGMCCSGGGIRSAAFNLGALQALQQAVDPAGTRSTSPRSRAAPTSPPRSAWSRTAGGQGAAGTEQPGPTTRPKPSERPPAVPPGLARGAVPPQPQLLHGAGPALEAVPRLPRAARPRLQPVLPRAVRCSRSASRSARSSIARSTGRSRTRRCAARRAGPMRAASPPTSPTRSWAPPGPGRAILVDGMRCSCCGRAGTSGARARDVGDAADARGGGVAVVLPRDPVARRADAQLRRRADGQPRRGDGVGARLPGVGAGSFATVLLAVLLSSGRARRSRRPCCRRSRGPRPLPPSRPPRAAGAGLRGRRDRRSAPAAGDSSSPRRGRCRCPTVGDPAVVWLAGAGALAGFVALYFVADLNTWSLHPFYRRRLCTAFALKRVPGRRRAPEAAERDSRARAALEAGTSEQGVTGRR